MQKSINFLPSRVLHLRINCNNSIYSVLISLMTLFSGHLEFVKSGRLGEIYFQSQMLVIFLLLIFGFTSQKTIEPRRRENRSSGFPTRSNINRPAQSQKQVRSLKFRISEDKKLYYPCSENKGAD